MKTWETKDGSGFRFSFTESGGGQERFRVKGVAVMDEIGGVAEYSEPVQRRVPLPPGTLFPASHIAAVIKRADNGGGHFGHMVFGGTAANEPYQVSAVIGARENSEARHPEIEKFLGGVKSWKGRLAYFPVVVEKNTPEFELSIIIREDGIVEHIAQDYGDHVVDARLNQIEILPNLDCTVR